MQTNRKTHVHAAIMALALVLSTFPASAAIMYHAVLDTSSLIGNPAGPFSLDFQFNDGEGTGNGNNTVTLSNFTFGGGSASGSPTTFGGVSGSLSGGISFADTSAFNEIYEGFTPGSSLGFDILLTTNLNPSLVPDLFTFAILDSSLANIQTTDAADQFISITVDSATPLLQTFASAQLGISIGAPELEVVPEPGTALFGVALVGMIAARRRRTL